MSESDVRQPVSHDEEAGGDASWKDVLVSAEQDLRTMAAAFLRKERVGHTLQTTALVNEAYLRLTHASPECWSNRAHFCAAAARAMRRVLIDHARWRTRRKRSSRGARLDRSLDQLPAGDDRNALVAAVGRAVEELEQSEARAASVVDMRFFCGLSEDQVADRLGISRRTVSKDWRFAKAWLREWIDRNTDCEL